MATSSRLVGSHRCGTTKIDEMQAAAQVLDGEERNKAYQDLLTYVRDTHLPHVYMSSIQAIYGLSERTTWEPRTDNLILLKDVQIAV